MRRPGAALSLLLCCLTGIAMVVDGAAGQTLPHVRLVGATAIPMTMDTSWQACWPSVDFPAGPGFPADLEQKPLASPDAEPADNDASADETLADETPVDETPVDETPVDETPVDETPVDETPVDETPVDETPVDETPVDETPVDETPVDETPVDETPVDETPVDETPVDETPVDETPVDETPVDETPVDETPVDETPVDETPVDETPVDETPVDETPVDETPVDETPVDETPVDDAPADVATAELAVADEAATSAEPALDTEEFEAVDRSDYDPAYDEAVWGNPSAGRTAAVPPIPADDAPVQSEYEFQYGYEDEYGYEEFYFDSESDLDSDAEVATPPTTVPDPATDPATDADEYGDYEYGDEYGATDDDEYAYEDEYGYDDEYREDYDYDPYRYDYQQSPEPASDDAPVAESESAAAASDQPSADVGPVEPIGNEAYGDYYGDYHGDEWDEYWNDFGLGEEYGTGDDREHIATADLDNEPVSEPAEAATPTTEAVADPELDSAPVQSSETADLWQPYPALEDESFEDDFPYDADGRYEAPDFTAPAATELLLHIEQFLGRIQDRVRNDALDAREEMQIRVAELRCGVEAWMCESGVEEMLFELVARSDRQPVVVKRAEKGPQPTQSWSECECWYDWHQLAGRSTTPTGATIGSVELAQQVGREAANAVANTLDGLGAACRRASERLRRLAGHDEVAAGPTPTSR